MTVFDRMIVSDVIKTLLAVLFVLILIIISNRFVALLGQAFEGRVSTETIFILLGLRMITIGIVFLPPASFAAVLLVLGRLYRDSEMSAMAASGVGTLMLYRYVFLLLVPLSLITFGLALQVLPWSVKEANDLMLKEAQTMHLRLISAGQFNEYTQSDLVFYIESIDENNDFHNVFVHNRHSDIDGVVVASSGYMKNLADGQYVVLQNGYRYEGKVGQANFEISQFDEYAVRINDNIFSSSYVHPEARKTSVLLSSGTPEDMSEFYRRLSIPLGMLVLGFLAIPLSRIAPRGGIYGNLMSAFLIYVIYENLLKVSHSWISRSVLPIGIGDWWAYLILIALAFIMLTRMLGISWMIQVLKGNTAGGWGRS